MWVPFNSQWTDNEISQKLYHSSSALTICLKDTTGKYRFSLTVANGIAFMLWIAGILTIIWIQIICPLFWKRSGIDGFKTAFYVHDLLILKFFKWLVPVIKANSNQKFAQNDYQFKPKTPRKKRKNWMHQNNENFSLVSNYRLISQNSHSLKSNCIRY